jgi:gas vesicle protein
MKSDRIYAVPFMLPPSGSLIASKDLDSVETAVALLLIELERKKEDELASVSKFSCPLWIHPLDESKALVFDGSDFSSSKINLQILDFDVPFNLNEGDFFAFVDELEDYVKKAVSGYQSKPKGSKLRGWPGEDFTSEIRDLLPKLEEWTNVKQFEVIEPSYTIDKEFLDESGLEWFPTDGLIEREKKKHKATLEIIDSRIEAASEQYKNLKSDYKEKEEELKSETQEKLQEEKAKKESLASRLTESKPDRKMPLPGRELYDILKDITEHSETVRTIVDTEDIYEILDEISDFRDSADELRDFLREMEGEYLAYKREVEKFYAERDREARRIEADYKARQNAIESELEENLDTLLSEIEDYEDAIEEAKALRERLVTAFQTWKERTDKAVVEYEEFTIPLKRLPNDQTLLIYVPFYVAEYRRRQRRAYEVVSPVTITDRRQIVRLKGISRLANDYRNEIERGNANKNFEVGLRSYNYLLNPEIAQEFSRGMSLLERLDAIDSNTATRVKSAYDQHFRIKLEE